LRPIVHNDLSIYLSIYLFIYLFTIFQVSTVANIWWWWCTWWMVSIHEVYRCTCGFKPILWSWVWVHVHLKAIYYWHCLCM